ncbi:MAG: Sapep family Mn(2+)-dependent dipeptidase [Clostridia bacterium]|nr:Sapep family Mn(2+)-dependent dipeptidase [Clostridia bacterium]
MINREYDKKITAWLDANRDKIVEEWMELIRIPSVEGEPLPGAPFGVECLRALSASAELFRADGFDTKIACDGKYGLAKWERGEKTIGLFGHSDVVPAGDGWIFTEPFSPIVKEGTLIGRGSADNKSGIIAALCAMRALRECNIPIKSTLLAFLGSNEETGMQDIDAFIENEEMPTLSIIPDADFPCSTGEKGIIHAWAESTSNLSDIIDFKGGSAFNIILDEVDVTLKYSPALESEIKNKINGNDKFSLGKDENGNLSLRALGVAKHAAYPKGSVNAAAKVAELLSDCPSLSGNDRKILASVAKFFSCYYGEGLGIQHDDSDFGPLSAANGMVKVNAGKLRISIDIRYGASFGAEDLEARLNSTLAENGWSIAEITNSPGFSIDKNSPIPGVMESIYNEITGREEHAYVLSGGTYARHLKNAFSVGVKAPSPDGSDKKLQMPDGHGGEHERDECIVLAEFFRAVRIIIHMIIGCDAAINS